MFTTLRHYWSVGTCMGRLALQRQFEYPLYLLNWLIMNPLQYFGGVWLLKVLVDNFRPLAGWDFAQLSFLYGMSLLSHGLHIIFFIQTWWIDTYVTQGHFDRFLVRPMNVYFQFMVRNINLIGVFDLIPGVTIFIYGCHAVHFQWTPLNTLLMLGVVLGGMFLRAGIYTILGSIGFWTLRSRPLVRVGETVMERGTLYPLALYPLWYQWMLTVLLPIGFISYYPACQFVGQTASTAIPLGLAIWTPVVGALTMLFSQALFRQGLKQYESTGS
jgi:ABC-2 type transport system permease protein